MLIALSLVHCERIIRIVLGGGNMPKCYLTCEWVITTSQSLVANKLKGRRRLRSSFLTFISSPRAQGHDCGEEPHTHGLNTEVTLL